MEKSSELFRSELEALYNLNHPNILKILGVEFKKQDVVSIITEFIPGDSLDSILKQHGVFSEKTIQVFIKQIIDAVGYIHANLVLHRDLKLPNIMLVQNNYIKVIDFGTAKRFGEDDQTLVEYGMLANTFIGTFPYMSPELLQFIQYNSKNDIWSIGVCIYEMSTGQPCISRLNKNGRSELVFLAAYSGTIQSPNLSPTANDFLQACLIKQLDQRPSANKLLQHPFIRNCINPAMGSNNLAPLNPTPYQNFQYPF